MIKATFAEGIDVVTALGLTQWDYGQTLEIHGLTLPTTFQVHFASKRVTQAVVRLGTTTNGVGSVVIPDTMLEQDTDLRAWIYIVGDGTGETIKLIQLPLQTRLKPENYIDPVTPSQQTVLEKFLADINTATETVTEAVQGHMTDTNNPHDVTLAQVVGENAVPVANGGTGATTAAEARTNLGITPANIGAEPTISKLPVSKGGTGAGTAESARENLGVTPSNIGAEPTITTLEIARGGTGATDAETARKNIGAAAADHTHNLQDLSGTLPIASGGTGATTRKNAAENIMVPTGTATNANDCVDIGFYATSPDTINIPIATYGVLSVYKPNQSWIIQVWTITNSAELSMYVRKNINNAGFGSWYKIFGSDSAIPIASGGTGANSLEAAQTNIMGVNRYLSETDDILALAPGFYSGPNNAKTSANYPKSMWAPLVMVWGERQSGIGEDGYHLGGWSIIIIEYDCTVWVRRRNWSAWSNWTTIRNNKTIEIQVGTASVGTSGATITFPNAFSGVPVVTANSSNQTSVKVENVTASSVKLTAGTSGSTVQWQAIYIP